MTGTQAVPRLGLASSEAACRTSVDHLRAFAIERHLHIADHRDATVQVSGPFIKDKFWFFGSLQNHRIYDTQPGAPVDAAPTTTPTSGNVTVHT